MSGEEEEHPANKSAVFEEMVSTYDYDDDDDQLT